MGRRAVPSRPVWVALGVFCVSACDLPVEPSLGPQLRIQLQVAQADDTSVARVLQKVSSLTLRLTRGDAVMDTVLLLSVAGGVARARVYVRPPPGDGPIDLRAELRSSSALLFDGVGVTSAASASRAHIVLRPVPARLATISGQRFDALGPAMQLWSEIYFATGDRWEGVAADWSSLDPDVVQVEAGDRAVPRANGVATLQATFHHLARPVQFTVAQKPSALSGIAPADTTVTVGDSFHLRVFGEDLAGFPLLPGAVVSWVTGGGITVDSIGAVTATSPGTAFAHAVLGTERQTATITVVPGSLP